MSIILHDAVIRALKEARAAFFAGNDGEYEAKMREAQAGIEAIRSLGEPMDGSTGRPIEVLTLSGEYAIQAALPLLRQPGQAAKCYERADVSLVSLLGSQVAGPEDPWLPGPASLLEFFGADAERADGLAAQLDRAAALYGRVTRGGGGGVALLYRAELAGRKGETERAAALARQALEARTGDRWMEPVARRLLRQSGEKEDTNEHGTPS